MKFWFKKDKDKNEENSYAGFNPISGGNFYDVEVDLRNKKEIDRKTLPDVLNNNKNVSGINKEIQNVTKGIIEDKVPTEFFLLNLHAYYFCNTIKYKCEDASMISKIQKLIRCAFMYGKACVYARNEKDVGVFYIVKMDTDGFGNVTYLEIGNVDLALESEIKDPILSNTLIIPPEEFEHVHIFQWGTKGLSAWITTYPFVKSQHMMLQMLNIQSFSYNKKFIYKVGNQSTTLEEMQMFFDPLNMFAVVFSDEEIGNTFNTFNEEGRVTGSARDFVAFFREYCDIWYQILGKNSNVDFKKERNVTTEVEASQGSIETIQREWLVQFDIFVKQFNEDPYLKKYRIEFNLEKINEEEEINDNNESEDKTTDKELQSNKEG